MRVSDALATAPEKVRRRGSRSREAIGMTLNTTQPKGGGSRESLRKKSEKQLPRPAPIRGEEPEKASKALDDSSKKSGHRAKKVPGKRKEGNDPSKSSERAEEEHQLRVGFASPAKGQRHSTGKEGQATYPRTIPNELNTNRNGVERHILGAPIIPQNKLRRD